MYEKQVLNNPNLEKNCNFKEMVQTPLFIPMINIYDVLDNLGATKLIRQIHKLKKNKNLEIDINYKKTMFNRYNYIHPQFDNTSHGSLATVRFLDDRLIKEIDITWTQINNEEATICYSFIFKEWLDSEVCLKEYTTSNWSKLYKYWFIPYYRDIKFYIENEHKNVELEHKLFYYLLQGIIIDMFYTTLGKRHVLPVSTLNIVEKETMKLKKYLKNPFFEATYIDKKSELKKKTIFIM